MSPRHNFTISKNAWINYSWFSLKIFGNRVIYEQLQANTKCSKTLYKAKWVLHIALLNHCNFHMYTDSIYLKVHFHYEKRVEKTYWKMFPLKSFFEGKLQLRKFSWRLEGLRSLIWGDFFCVVFIYELFLKEDVLNKKKTQVGTSRRENSL